MEQGGHGPDWVPINKESYWDMVGFAFFMFEGIGSLLPVMREVERPEIYPRQTVMALLLLCCIYVLFSFLCYYAWGTDLDESVVTEMLPADNVFVQIMKLLFCVNLMISYPITIKPLFTTLESLIGKKETNTDETNAAEGDETQMEEDDGHGGIAGPVGQETLTQYWIINVMRSAVVALCVIVVILVYDSLDKFISVAGSIFGMINVLLLPGLAHLKLMAKTKTDRIKDYCLIGFACCMMAFLPATILIYGN